MIFEKDNQIFLHRPIHQHHWLHNGSDLRLTTLFTSTSYLNKNYTLLFNDFYLNAKKMQTLQLIFNDRLSHTQFFSTQVASSAESLHHGWLSLLKKNIQKTLGHLRTTGQAIVNSCWRYSLISKTAQTVAANEDAFTNHIDPPILDATGVNPSTLPPPKNIKFLERQQNNAFQFAAVAPYGNLNTGMVLITNSDLDTYLIYSTQTVF